ncbi:MAG: DUF4838 domain-containing protein [Verrucomicrobia bacterium]|nr:DUF4838 domain-containing protein [Verrucomicrobiota bacterium]
MQRFAGQHPEYFALLENGKRDTDLSLPGNHGHLCFSQKGLEEEIYQDAEAFLTGKPPATRNIGREIEGKWVTMWDPNCFEPGFFNIMPQDNHELAPCQCAACKPLYDQGKAHEIVWGFVTRIARRLQSNRIPGTVTSGAYMSAGPVPSCDFTTSPAWRPDRASPLMARLTRRFGKARPSCIWPPLQRRGRPL